MSEDSNNYCTTAFFKNACENGLRTLLMSAWKNSQENKLFSRKIQLLTWFSFQEIAWWHKIFSRVNKKLRLTKQIESGSRIESRVKIGTSRHSKANNQNYINGLLFQPSDKNKILKFSEIKNAQQIDPTGFKNDCHQKIRTGNSITARKNHERIKTWGNFQKSIINFEYIFIIFTKLIINISVII